MLSVNTFSELETQFLQPLVARRHIQREEISLEEMQNWQRTNGKLFNSFFEIFGTRISFAAEPNNEQPPAWDQPIYRQGTSTIILFIDEEQRILVNCLFEPGNAQRGYKQQGLILTTSCKFSPGRIKFLQTLGQTPPLADLKDHPQAKVRFFHKAPGDGARADKENEHFLIQLPAQVLEEAVRKLPPPQGEFYALLPLSILRECYEQGLVNEHLRDVASMLLFLE